MTQREEFEAALPQMGQFTMQDVFKSVERREDGLYKLVAVEAAWRAWQAAQAAQPAEMPAWLPIESAPKDGATIIVKLSEWNPAVTTARFRDGNWWRDNNGYGYTVQCIPTVWMQPPAAPDTSQKGEA